jgi:cell division protein FtsX
MKNPLELINKTKLQTVSIVFFVLQIMLTVGIVGYLSFRNGQKAIEELAENLQLEVKSGIDRHLDSYREIKIKF